MGMISRLYTFVNGNKAMAQQVNAELDQIIVANNDNVAVLATKVDKIDGKALSTEDFSTQEKSDLAANTAVRHSHGNKALLDAYTQTEANLSDAVAKRHDHDNKALLDTYTQTNTGLSTAVTNAHVHSNKALLDTYAQTESNLADAVSKKHAHANTTALNNLSGVNTGDQDLSGYALKTNVLEKTNTTAFTPTADHHPATKKYVDDNAGGVPYLSTINGVVTAIVDDDTKLPTSGAVVDYVSGLGGGDMLKATYDPTNKSADAFAMANMVEGTTNKIFTATERTKLSGIATGANNYTHPANHPPSIITQDSSNRFVTDTEKSTWNGKANTVTYTGTLASASWTGSSAPYSQTITVTGMASTDEPIYDLTLSGTYATDVTLETEWVKVFDLDTGTNQVTVKAHAKPTVDLPFHMKVVR